MTAIISESTIIDDNGYHWVYNNSKGKIVCVEAEEELLQKYQKNPTDGNKLALQDNGYYADDLLQGLELLIEYGYIEA
jgi:hypothetical protein